jgi:hypothetical protein
MFIITETTTYCDVCSIKRNKVNNLKKQAKKKFYANINENLDELKSANGKLYWKTMNMLIKNENSFNETQSNQTLSSFPIITSLAGMHILAIFKNIDVKSETLHEYHMHQLLN